MLNNYMWRVFVPKEKAIFKINMPSFFKHNKKPKKGYTHFMVSKTIFSDHKYSQLSCSDAQFWLYLVSCCCDLATDSFQLASTSLPRCLKLRSSCEESLMRLQSLQLLTYEKIATPYRREEKRIESTNVERIEVQRGSEVVKKQESDNNKNLNARIWSAYKDAYFLRYKTEPVRNASVNSKISQLAKRLGADAEKIVVFYVNHNDPFYIRQLHQIGACLTNAEALYTQFKRGVAVLPRDVKNFEQNQNMNDLMNELKKGGF